MEKQSPWLAAIDKALARALGGAPALELLPAAAGADTGAAPDGAPPAPPRMLFAADGDDPQKPTVRVTRRRQTTSDPSQRQTADSSTRDNPTGSGAQPGRSGSGSSRGGGPPVGTMLPMILGLFASKRTRPIAILLLVGLAIWWFAANRFGNNVQETVQQTQQQAQVQQQSSGDLTGAAAGVAGILASVLGGNLPAVMPTPEAPVASQNPLSLPGAPAAAPAAPAAPASAPAAAATGGGDTWTVMLYADADDEVLEQDIFTDFNEAERVGSSDNVRIVAQLDRFRGGYSGDGNWTSAKRYLIEQDQDLSRIGSPVMEDLGEVDMADPQTLVDFIAWSVQNYPADKYALILSDHGMGWPGGWSDPTSNTGADRNFPLSRAMPHDMLYLHEVDAALTAARQGLGIDKFELIGMDACLMSHAEVFDMLSDHARYGVASQETEPALGWAYAAFLEPLEQNPAMSGADLGQLIVQTYIDGDQRIVDPQARAEFVGGGRPGAGLFGGTPPAEAVARQLSQNITLTAADLTKMPAFNDAFNNFLVALQQVNPRALAQARSYTQNFTSVFGRSVPPSYIDVGHFALLAVKGTGDANLQQAAVPLVNAINDLVVAEKSGPGKPGATGISVYFPDADLYRNAATGPQSYNVASKKFVDRSLWDEFLTYYYTGNNFQVDSRTAAAPSDPGAVRSPGAGGITLSPVTLSADTAAPSSPVLMSADVAGENIAYIRLFVGEVDPAANSIRLIDSDYLQFGETQDLNGVYYPDYGSTDFRLEFEWEPYVTAVTDGQTNAVALFNPESYGESIEKAQYAVDGIYTYGETGSTRSARAIFRAGVLQQVFSYTADDGTGSPWEITPNAGDTFTVQEEWVDLDADGNIIGTGYEPGATVTFPGGETLRWTELNAAPGQYVVGFVVEDFDGNEKATYAPITVTAAQ